MPGAQKRSAIDAELETPTPKNQKNIFTAADNGDLEVLQQFIAQNVDVKSAATEGGFKGWTLIHIAALANKPQVVQVLIAAGVDLNLPVSEFVQDFYRHMTPLQMASVKGHAQVVQLLIDAGVDPEQQITESPVRGIRNFTPLQLASCQGHAQVVQLLIAADADPNKHVYNSNEFLGGMTPLHIAARQGNAQVVQLLIAAGVDPAQPVSITKCDFTGMTPLQIAYEFDYNDVARLLVESGASISDTTLIDELYQKEPVILKLLTESKDQFANSIQELNPSTAQLEKALFIAISQGLIDNIDIIINKLVSISSTDDQVSVHKKIQEIFLQTMRYHSVQKNDAMLKNLINRLPRDHQLMHALGQALLVATKNKNQNATEQLLQAGAHPYWANRYVTFALSNQIDPKIKEWYQQLQNRWKLSATVITEKVHHTSFLSLLSHTACDQIASYVSTSTPAYVRLIRAFEKKDLNAIQAALSNGADPNTRNEQGIPLLWIGFENPDIRQRHLMLTLLLNRGAQANPINKNGTSLFEHIKTLSAVERGHRFEAIKKLANHTSDPDLIDEINKPTARTLWAAVGSSLH